MKKLIVLLIISFSAAFGVSAQNLVLKNGLYYSENGTLYSGTCTSYFLQEGIVSEKKGSKKSTLEITDGKINGAATYYYENGSIMETGAFVNNEKNGQWLRWDDQGHKIAEAFYVSGKKDGTWLVWDGKGTKRYEMVYALGEKIGKWSMWDENGKLTSEKLYSNI